MLVNLARDRWRLLGRRPRESEPPADFTDPAVVGPAEQLADRDVLVRALRALPAQQRAVVVLRFWDGLSVAETAVLLSCTDGTVKSYTSRALQRLRELLADQPNERGALC